jgi:p-hydroxybenzoate 3-monooxygenase
VRTQVGIVGAGPAGLVLSLLLADKGIGSVVLEARSREHVEARVRAGLLEPNTVDVLRSVGAADRLERQGLVHDGISLRRHGRTVHVDVLGLTGRHLTIYGQQEVVRDLIAARLAAEGPLVFEAGGVALHGIGSDAPSITWGDGEVLECDWIAGCDGFHGASRGAVAGDGLREWAVEHPFAWLGILAEAAPTTDELIYGWHEDGFALYSMRSPSISRLYLQVPADAALEDWPDERIWAALQARLGAPGWRVGEGPILERSITPLRAFVAAPLRHGRLLLAGDAAHIVPPTGAKGLNLAVNDVRLMAAALERWYADGDPGGVDAYSETALRRVWRAQDFAHEMTALLHDLGDGPFGRRLQLARLEQLERSETARRALAENYVGLRASADF